MKQYHGQASSPTLPPSVKAAPSDVRDQWRRNIAADPRLGAGALRVALIVLNFANRSGLCTVGVHRIATDVQRDRRNVERGLRQLVAAGHLEREPGGGVPGRGGRTSATWLKVPAAASPKVPAAAAEVPAAAVRSTGDGRPEVPATGAGQTLLTHKTPEAADAPGLEAGSATARNDAHGSATAGPNGEVLRLLGELETSARAEPRPVRDAVLSALRQKFGLPAKRAVNDNENSPTADGCGGSGSDAPQAK